MKRKHNVLNLHPINESTEQGDMMACVQMMSKDGYQFNITIPYEIVNLPIVKKSLNFITCQVSLINFKDILESLDVQDSDLAEQLEGMLNKTLPITPEALIDMEQENPAIFRILKNEIKFLAYSFKEDYDFERQPNVLAYTYNREKDTVDTYYINYLAGKGFRFTTKLKYTRNEIGLVEVEDIQAIEIPYLQVVSLIVETLKTKVLLKKEKGLDPTDYIAYNGDLIFGNDFEDDEHYFTDYDDTGLQEVKDTINKLPDAEPSISEGTLEV